MLKIAQDWFAEPRRKVTGSWFGSSRSLTFSRLGSTKLCAMSLIALILLLCASWLLPTNAQTSPLSERMAATAMKALYRDSARNESGYPAKWTYDFGFVLKGIEGIWYRTGDVRYFNYIRQGLDHFVNADGTIRTYQISEYNVDNILLGRNLLLLYKISGEEKYRKAAALLREQLRTQPRTSEGGFWHKKIYSSQMWLDGLYLGESSKFSLRPPKAFTKPQSGFKNVTKTR